MFSKLRDTASINTSGVGLGLSICKNIAEGMDGSIELDSTYDNGARFVVKLRAPYTDDHLIESD